jgi:predicted nucleic acid-binding protein
MSYMSDKIFLDTNILVYGSLKEKDNSTKREQVITLLANPEAKFTISTQIINEYYRVLLKKGFSDEDIQDSYFGKHYSPFMVVKKKIRSFILG